jgi:hypothetical protein
MAANKLPWLIRKSLWQILPVTTAPKTTTLARGCSLIPDLGSSVSGGAKVGQWSGGIVLLRGGVITGHWLG